MFLDCKNQYFENDYTAESDLKIQCNLHQYFSQKLEKIMSIILKYQRLLSVKDTLSKKMILEMPQCLISCYTMEPL